MVLALAAVAVLIVGRHSTDATGVDADADDTCCAGMAVDMELHCVMTEVVRQSGQVVG